MLFYTSTQIQICKLLILMYVSSLLTGPTGLKRSEMVGSQRGKKTTRNVVIRNSCRFHMDIFIFGS